jgi:chromosome segregation ATPase
MELLQSLEQKISSLVALVSSLKKENEELKKDLSDRHNEIQQLKGEIEMLESSLLNDTYRLQEQLNKEKELTKNVVDDLIKNIDAIIEGENQQL